MTRLRELVPRAWRGLGLLTLVAVLGSGCQTAGYYGQAICGQCQIVARREPIAGLLADAKTPEPLKEKLRLVLKLREFAEKELKLPVNGHYQSYVDVERRFAVWNVHAAPEFSLEPKSWWYPIVGRLKYRGYFSEAQARRYARRLEQQGFEVYVGGVEAYSTLGWFKDPVLNTFIHHDEADLAEILFHELAHQKLFVRGDTDFDEAFATAVAEEGVRRWLRGRGDQQATEKYRIEVERQERFVGLVMRARGELKALYGDAESNGKFLKRTRATRLAPLEEWRQKQEVLTRLRGNYARLKAEWGGYAGYDAWFAQPLNNAQLNTVEAYYRLLPGFRAVLQSRDGDLEQFYREVRVLGKLPKEERHRRLQAALVEQ